MRSWKTFGRSRRERHAQSQATGAGESTLDDVPTPAVEVDEPADQDVSVASQWQLMWWKFRRHKLAMICGVVVLLFYIVAIFVEFIAPYNPSSQDASRVYHPPTSIHIRDQEGDFHLPFIYD